MSLLRILGISGLYHDSAAALIEDNEIVAAAQEERFTRVKHDSSFPTNACRYCLNERGVSLEGLDAVVYYEKPFLKFERLLETYYRFAPKGVHSFIKAVPGWIEEKLFFKRLIRKELKKIGELDRRKLRLFFPEHHLSHAASAFYPAPFDEAAILTIDGVGEWATSSISWGKGKEIEVLKELHFPHSLGLFYTSFTYWLGFQVNGGEYKLMGLAPYGVQGSERVEGLKRTIRDHLMKVKEDGSVWLDQKYFRYATGLRMVNEKKWERLFGFSRRSPEEPILQFHCDLALAVQELTEEVMIKMAREAKRLTGSKNLCLAGGVALNCVANSKLLDQGVFEDLFIQPASGDAGGAIGAGLAVSHLHFRQDLPQRTEKEDGMSGAYLGPRFSKLEIERVSREFEWRSFHYPDSDELFEQVAELVAQGQVVGWFQGRMEFGPRALGNRSIIGDPRRISVAKRINERIKGREEFRPLAPSVLEEDRSELFQLSSASPYMLLVSEVKEDLRILPSQDETELPVKERLYVERSLIPAVTHVDGSARVQTVNRNRNPRYWKLLKKVKERTGYGVLINTSFNVGNEPIVCSPEDAFRSFIKSEMDHLVMEDHLFPKREEDLKKYDSSLLQDP